MSLVRNQPCVSHEALMARFQAGFECDAFEQIVCFYMRPALAVARQILSDSTLAEDAVQETFLRVIRKRKQYIPTSPFSRWFYTILRNVCVDMLRRRAREKGLAERIAGRCERAVRADSSETLELLSALRAGERDVLLLRIIHGLSFRDIAFALDISEEAAKKRAQRAMRRLRAKVRDSEGYAGKPAKLPIAL
jgi:RNA polymerase sigma-70 factor (ECF subfamily)